MSLAVAPRAERPGRRAVEFARWAATEFGTPGPRPGTVVINHTQKALTATYGRGEGTIAWYMSQLRSAGVVLSSRPLVLDLQSLEEPIEPARPSPQPDRPELVALLSRHAELVAQAAQLLADMTAIQSEMARVVANEEPAEVADLAPVRDIQEVRKVDLYPLPGLPSNRSANPGPRNPRSPTPAARTPLDEVDRLVEPLRALCRSTNRPDHLDDRGRRILAELTPEALEAGVAAIRREAKADTRITRPLGLLIDRARKHDVGTFTTTAVPSPAPTPSPRPSCPGCGGSGLRRLTDGAGQAIAGVGVPCRCTLEPG